MSSFCSLVACQCIRTFARNFTCYTSSLVFPLGCLIVLRGVSFAIHPLAIFVQNSHHRDHVLVRRRVGVHIFLGPDGHHDTKSHGTFVAPASKGSPRNRGKSLVPSFSVTRVKRSAVAFENVLSFPQNKQVACHKHLVETPNQNRVFLARDRESRTKKGLKHRSYSPSGTGGTRVWWNAGDFEHGGHSRRSIRAGQYR